MPLDDLDLLDDGRVQREDALDPLAETHLPHGYRLADARVVAGQQDSLENLDPLLLAFLDLDVNLDLVTRLQRRKRLLAVSLFDFLDDRVLHVPFSSFVFWLPASARLAWTIQRAWILRFSVCRL